jgi:hypothetical protein
MDEKPEQIIGHIEAQRDQLGRNLNELETRVRATTDWRTYFEKNPALALGAALGGGILLGAMVNSRRHSSPKYGRSSSSSYAGAAATGGALGFASSGSSGSSAASSGSSSSRRSSLVSSPVTSMQMRQISETMDHIKAALIAFGISKAKEFISQAIPGLDPHLQEAAQRGRQHSSGPSWQPSSQESGSDRSSGATHSWQSAGAQQHEPSPVTF